MARIKWLPVISGAWWMGTGEKFVPASTVPVPAGSYVVHHANKIHSDGATATPAEKK